MDGHRADYEEKLITLRKWLEEKKADGLLLTTVANFAWLTHGRAYVSIASETSVARILVTADKVTLFTTTNEAPRLEREEVAGWGLDLVAWPWYERFEDHWPRHPAASGRILVDRDIEAELSLLRRRLSAHERRLLRELGSEAAEILEGFALEIEPGLRENELAGRLARAAFDAGMEPLVLNMATDERALLYRHAIPTARGLERYGVFSVCFRRFGLHVTLTRSLHFGPVPDDLAARHRAACALEAFAQANSIVGAPVGTLVASILGEYRNQGWPDEWTRHPIGGCLGYQAREFDARPGDPSLLFEGQAFCWNPTIAGAKSEETFIVSTSEPAAVTAGTLFPRIRIRVGERDFARPAILER